MFRQSIAVGLVTLLLAVPVLGVTLVAMQQNPAPAEKQPQKMMSMGDMMKGCREHCQATTKSLDQLAITIADAKTSNDVNKMRSALDQTEKSLTDMREHMKMCMNMMNMMEKMHGKRMQ